MKLVLENGMEMRGQGFGASGIVGGEVVFNTGMTGYVETLTDPSYRGQILILTYPLIGNYGVPAPRIKDSLDKPFESNEIQVQGLVVQNYIDAYSHHTANRSLHQWLKVQGIPAVSGIDTRTLTRNLRATGTMRGWLFQASMPLEEAQAQAATVDMYEQVFYQVAPRETIHYAGGELTILLIDVGAKDNIVRSLLSRGVSVIRAPWHGPILELAEQTDGILIGNGPGDPTNLGPLVEQLSILLDRYNKPIFGICLGNQLLTLAAGGSTYNLPYGHRGVNQPVQDLITRHCYITSQNHGYAVNDQSLKADWEPWFVNINDGTNEGIRSRHRPHFGVQFHPEASPGPRDTEFLFDEFLRIVGAMARH
jgi:carbamoyl-phosphate synthase small subunit